MVSLTVNFFISTMYLVQDLMVDNTIENYILQTSLCKVNQHEWIFL